MQNIPYAIPSRSPSAFWQRFNPLQRPRTAIVMLLIVLAIWPGEVGGITRGLMRDAYVGASVFVAMTLLLVYGSEKLFRFDLGDFLRTRTIMQIPIAGLLGMSPGCAGAIVVTSAYSAGNVSLGALVAALTSTMGDAALPPATRHCAPRPPRSAS